ncbi:MAG: hypothetical protein ACRDPV_01465, partial [Gaiellaceae bacterium]
MAAPAQGGNRTWRFKLDDTRVLEVSAPLEPTERQMRRRGRWPLVVGTLIAAAAIVRWPVLRTTD